MMANAIGERVGFQSTVQGSIPCVITTYICGVNGSIAVSKTEGQGSNPCRCANIKCRYRIMASTVASYASGGGSIPSIGTKS